MNGKAFQVARWEYIEKIKSKAFLISLFLMPMIMLGMGILPGILASRADTESKVIGIIDQSDEVIQPLSKIMEERFKLPNGEPNYMFRSITADGDFAKAKMVADSLVVSNQIEGYLVIGKAYMNDTTLEYRSENVGNFRVIERLTRAIRDIVVERKLLSRGLSRALAKELTSPIELKTIKLSKTGEEEEAGFEQVFFGAYIFMMMMFFLVMTSGQLLVRSMLEEKSNRIVEVLMSSCSANDLMAGKIIGLSGLGLTQLAFWGLIGLAISLKFTLTVVSLSGALILFVYFVLGYLLYAAIFVAAGAPVSTEQEAQQLTSYLTIILILPIVLAIPVMQNPNSLMVKILSFVPLITPTMMAMRIPIQMPSVMEIVGTVVVLAASAFGAMWAAGKIFRTTILAYGKRPSLGELIRLVRSS
jgi:ABC-2 type transport system permease protein